MSLYCFFLLNSTDNCRVRLCREKCQMHRKEYRIFDRVMWLYEVDVGSINILLGRLLVLCCYLVVQWIRCPIHDHEARLWELISRSLCRNHNILYTQINSIYRNIAPIFLKPNNSIFNSWPLSYINCVNTFDFLN